MKRVLHVEWELGHVLRGDGVYTRSRAHMMVSLCCVPGQEGIVGRLWENGRLFIVTTGK